MKNKIEQLYTKIYQNPPSIQGVPEAVRNRFFHWILVPVGEYTLKRQNDNVDAATDALANSFTAYVC